MRRRKPKMIGNENKFICLKYNIPISPEACTYRQQKVKQDYHGRFIHDPYCQSGECKQGRIFRDDKAKPITPPPPPKEKKCVRCKKVLPITAFGVGNYHCGQHVMCRKCVAECKGRRYVDLMQL